MAVLDWIRRGRDQVEQHDARQHNTEQENELLDLAMERWHIAETEKVDHEGRNLHNKWLWLDKLYRGRQWQGDAPEHKSRPVLNFTFSLIESIIPRITDNRPEVLVMARDSGEDKQLAEQLQRVHPYLWYVNRMHTKLPEVVRTMAKYGTAIMKTIWDPDFHTEDVGDVRYSVVHPMNFYPDPRASDIPEMEYCFVRSIKPMEFFHRRWPDKGRLVVPDDEWMEQEQLSSRGQVSSGEEAATLTEYWFRDEDGNVCVMWYSGHVVLDIVGGKYDDSGEPIYRHNEFPFAKMVDYPADKEFWGIGEVELVEMLQRLINNFEAQIIDNTRLMSNAQWIVNKVHSGIREDEAWIFDNRPGEVIFTHNGGVEQLPGAPIPAHIPEHMERLIHAMEQILGIHDVVQGRQPSGVRAASAIIALQESANIRVRQKNRSLEQMLLEIADQTNWLVLEHYEEPRNMRVLGQDTPSTLDIREALEHRLLDEAAEVGMELPPPGMTGLEEEGLTPEDATIPGMEGAPPQGRRVEPGMEPGMLAPDQREALVQMMEFPTFDVEVKVGPSVPYSQALLYEQAKEFYQLGIIDRRAVLETTNFPNKEEILARIEGQEAAAAEAAMAEGGGGERVGEATLGGAELSRLRGTGRGRMPQG